MTTSPRRAVATGALAVAVLDMLDCIVVYGLLRGVTVTQCFQGVASGVLGRDSFQGGWPTVLLGGVLHLFNASVIVTVYALASQRVALLTRRPVLSAILYGCLVFLVMNFVVVPLSAARVMRITLVNLVNGFLGHIISVGLPCLWVIRASRPRETAAV
ncbi:MAG TPA: hypothetical protein VFP39_08980 [Gemmatimonadales bacterium]|nr:hypothetical protein [Gemmatimonadales bacterium]